MHRHHGLDIEDLLRPHWTILLLLQSPPLDAFGVSISAPLATVISVNPSYFFCIRHCRMHVQSISITAGRAHSNLSTGRNWSRQKDERPVNLVLYESESFLQKLINKRQRRTGSCTCRIYILQTVCDRGTPSRQRAGIILEMGIEPNPNRTNRTRTLFLKEPNRTRTLHLKNWQEPEQNRTQ